MQIGVVVRCGQGADVVRRCVNCCFRSDIIISASASLAYRITSLPIGRSPETLTLRQMSLSSLNDRVGLLRSTLTWRSRSRRYELYGLVFCCNESPDGLRGGLPPKRALKWRGPGAEGPTRTDTFVCSTFRTISLGSLEM